MARRRPRWNDTDKHFGPFTHSKDTGNYHRVGVVLESGDDEYPGCCLRLHGFKHTLTVWLPPVIRPYRVKHIATSWDEATIERLGRNWYYETFSRVYGAVAAEGSLHVRYGAQTHDSLSTKSKCYFFPWRQWRFVRFSLYDTNGVLFWQVGRNKERKGGAADLFKAQYEATQACPKLAFEFEDYDGQRITATTHIEEREWLAGEKWCAWLSWFRRPRVRRELSLSFSAEVGPEKGSWKGGTVGHGIELLDGELHEAGFRRYCNQEHRSKNGKFRLKYIGPAQEVAA